MKKYRIYFNRIEEFYIDLQANDIKEAVEEWERGDLQDEEDTGNSNIVITEIEEIKEEADDAREEYNTEALQREAELNGAEIWNDER